MPRHVTDAPALLVLEDGRTFRGEAYGAEGETFGEAVFATGMTGYQETLTDPSYHRQVVVMTAPHVGNTGMNDEDPESSRIWVAGYVVRDPARVPSSWRSRRSLDSALREQGVVGISGHRHPRPDPPPARARRDAGRHLHDRERPGGAARRGCGRPAQMAGANLSDEVSTTEPYVVPAVGERRFTVAALDLGIKANTPRMMAERGIETHVLPATATLDDVLRRRARRAVLLQRPRRPGGDDRRRSSCCAARSSAGIPYFGICFGNQLFGRALGLRHLQAHLRPPRDQPAGPRPHHRQGRGHRAQPRVRGPRPRSTPRRSTPVRRGDGQPRLPQRRRGRGARAPRRRRPADGVLGAVPPRGRRRPPRRGVPLRPLLRPDGPVVVETGARARDRRQPIGARRRSSRRSRSRPARSDRGGDA